MLFLPGTAQSAYAIANLIPSTIMYINEGDGGTPGGSNHILTEGGDNIAAENNDLLITET